MDSQLLMTSVVQSVFSSLAYAVNLDVKTKEKKKSRKINNKINRLHERGLRIAYEDYVSSFEELLIKDGSVTIHQRNLKVLATEMYKISRGTSPRFMQDLVEDFDTKYHTWSRNCVELDEDGNVKSST